jgi:hypothetical protein
VVVVEVVVVEGSEQLAIPRRLGSGTGAPPELS